jgi:peptide/nickel transport system substrate-binding protein
MWYSAGADREISSNFSNFKNPEVDRLILAARAEFDPDKRHALLRQVHRILHEEQPYTFIMESRNKVLVNKRLVNVNFSAEGFAVEKWRAVPWDSIDYSQPWKRDE